MSHYTGSVPGTEPKEDWRARAACLGRQDEMHPDNDDQDIENARSICRKCPPAVAKACFWDAVQTGDMYHGVRAGLRPGERRAVLQEIKERKLAASGLEAAA